MATVNPMQKTIKKIEQIRTKIADLIEEREWTETALLPLEEIKENLFSLVDSQAEKLQLDAQLIHAYPDIFQTNVRLREGLDTVNFGPLLCTLFGSEIKAKLVAMAGALDFEQGPPSAERPGLIAALDKQIQKLEIEEETIISDAEAFGFDVERRADCSPEIFLEFAA